MISRLWQMFRPRVGRQPFDVRYWHEYQPMMPVRLIDGHWQRPNGKIWRRLGNGGWEYRQDSETPEEADSRSW
jgi:hypothetical protein